MSDAIVVFMTAGSADEARRIANELIERQLAACVQILPEIESVYRWKDEIQHEKEVLMLAKTTGEQFANLEKTVRAMHSYETPEIVAVPISQVSEPYRGWLIQNVGGKLERP
jgi:periplasmic divalent cation tolerance protein